MRAFSRRGVALQTQLNNKEAAILLTLVGELIELLSPLGPRADDPPFWEAEPPPTWHDDPALARLFPDAYSNDQVASSDFLRYTQADQAIAKCEAASIVAIDIDDADAGWVTVPPDHIEAWMKTLTNLRLVLAERLGDERDNDAVYFWCGWMLESMLSVL